MVYPLSKYFGNFLFTSYPCGACIGNFIHLLSLHQFAHSSALSPVSHHRDHTCWKPRLHTHLQREKQKFLNPLWCRTAMLVLTGANLVCFCVVYKMNNCFHKTYLHSNPKEYYYLWKYEIYFHNKVPEQREERGEEWKPAGKWLRSCRLPGQQPLVAAWRPGDVRMRAPLPPLLQQIQGTHKYSGYKQKV